MRLWILGNGFDLAHGLPTSYKDYHQFLKKQGEKWFMGLLEYFFGYDVSSRKNILWSQLEKALGMYSLKGIYDFLQEGHTFDIDHAMRSVGEIEAEVQYHFVGICEKFTETFTQWCEGIDLSNATPKSMFGFSGTDKFLTFNYTDTVEQAYGIDEKQVLHIHGRASKGEELIVGHNNPATMPKGIKDDFIDHTANYRAIVDSINSLEKKTKRIIADNRLFFDGLGNVDEVMVYGHSVEEVDMPYFEEVEKSIAPGAHWTFYCYDKNKVRHYDDVAKGLGVSGSRYKIVVG